MKISAVFACLVCRAIHGLLRLINRGGTALPGKLALKICPDVLKILAQKVKVIAVTGTNGKTTSVRMLETALDKAGFSVFSNRSGANLISGITAEFILHADMFGRPQCEWAVIECDEAASKRVTAQLNPKVLLVTNLFRDQLDRYGSVYSPRDSIAAGAASSPETLLCLNADCPLAASIGELTPNGKIYFGLSYGSKTGPESGESAECPVCRGKMRYSWLSYANLGAFDCPFCGFSRHRPDVSVDGVTGDGYILSAHGRRHFGTVALPGLYNVYNAAGAIAAFTAAGFEPDEAISAAADFDCGFGRMERFALGKNGARMILIKNAAAADQTLEYIKSSAAPKIIAFVINSRTADGTDISWLNDADFGKLRTVRGLTRVYAAGERAEDIKNRLKTEEIACEVCMTYDKLIENLYSENNEIFILPTYTAMMELRKKLVRRLGGSQFWE